MPIYFTAKFLLPLSISFIYLSLCFFACSIYIKCLKNNFFFRFVLILFFYLLCSHFLFLLTIVVESCIHWKSCVLFFLSSLYLLTSKQHIWHDGAYADEGGLAMNEYLQRWWQIHNKGFTFEFVVRVYYSRFSFDWILCCRCSCFHTSLLLLLNNWEMCVSLHGLCCWFQSDFIHFSPLIRSIWIRGKCVMRVHRLTVVQRNRSRDLYDYIAWVCIHCVWHNQKKAKETPRQITFESKMYNILTHKTIYSNRLYKNDKYPRNTLSLYPHDFPETNIVFA